MTALAPELAVILHDAAHKRGVLEFEDSFAKVRGYLTPTALKLLGLEQHRENFVAADLAIEIPGNDLLVPSVASYFGLMWEHWRCPECDFMGLYDDSFHAHLIGDHHKESTLSRKHARALSRRIPAMNLWKPFPDQHTRDVELVRMLKEVFTPNTAIAMASRGLVVWREADAPELYYLQVYEEGYRFSPSLVFPEALSSEALPACRGCYGCHDLSAQCPGVPVVTRSITPLSGKLPEYRWCNPDHCPQPYNAVMIRSTTCDYRNVGVLHTDRIVVTGPLAAQFVKQQIRAGHRFFIDHNHTLIQITAVRRKTFLYLAQPALLTEVPVLHTMRRESVPKTLTVHYDYSMAFQYYSDIAKRLDIILKQPEMYFTFSDAQGCADFEYAPYVNQPSLVMQGPSVDKLYQCDYIITATGQSRYVCDSLTHLPALFPPELKQSSTERWLIRGGAVLIIAIVAAAVVCQ
jgi:hypothetical protein